MRFVIEVNGEVRKAYKEDDRQDSQNVAHTWLPWSESSPALFVSASIPVGDGFGLLISHEDEAAAVELHVEME